MCGIAGKVFKSGMGAVTSRDIAAMNAALTHRGPDGEGVYVSADRQAGLGHRRLAIIDRSDRAKQPMQNEDGSLHLVFNGEIYNHRALRADLIFCGHSFVSESDAEPILHLYEEYGDGCVQFLRGMFAFAIWDERKKRLFLARDRFGEKPLKYHLGVDSISFASEIKALFTSGIVPKPDLASLPNFFSFGCVSGPKTGFEGIVDLPPAHYASYENSVFSMTRYWQIDFAKKTTLAYGEAVEEIRHRLQEAVHMQCAADVPLGAFLSGGVDSAFVSALAKNEMPLRTFSFGFGGAGDERDAAAETSRALGTEHVGISAEPDIPSLLPKLVRLYESPYADSSAVPAYLLSERATRNVGVVLTGDGGDELFGGYLRHRYWNMGHIVKPDIYYDIASHFYFPYRGRTKRLSSLDDVFKLGIETFLPDDLLVKTDRATMAHGLEARSPFLDHHLAEFAASLPARWKVGVCGLKKILKDAGRGIVPERALAAPKRGFEAPVDRWFRGEYAAYAKEMLSGNSLASHVYVPHAEIVRMLAEHIAGYRNHGRRIWLLLCFELWNREFFKHSS